MVIDSSALIAIVRNEPEGHDFQRLIREAFPRLIAAPTVVEASVVALVRFGDEMLAGVQSYIAIAELEIVPMDPAHVGLAVEAYRRFGKGRHRAKLNFGDCLAYALARATGEPLLFKGDDFAATDIVSAA